MYYAPRLAFGCALILSGASAWALGAPPDEENSLILHSILGNMATMPGIVADLKPGEVFGITGACVSHAKGAEEVRVVFALDDDQGGYKAILATDQQKGDGVLQVRVPDLPGVANRTAEVQIFVVGRDTPVVCNAGSIHIG